MDNKLRVDLGSGRQKVEGYVSIDDNPITDPDILWDLNDGLPKRTWDKHGDGTEPISYIRRGSYKVFDDNTVDEIRSHHCFEHLAVEGFMKLMDELWLALKLGGILKIYVPNAECPRAAWGDPTHRKAFSTITFSYFTKEGLAGHPYTDKAWKILDGYPKVNGTAPDDLWELECWMTPEK